MADLDDELEEAAGDAMAVALLRFSRRLKAKLRAAGSVSEIEPALVRSLWAEQLPGLLAVVEGGWEAGLADTSARLRVEVRPRPLASETMLAKATNRLVDFADELWEVARAQLVEGVAAGEGIGQLAARLGRLPGLAEPRATVVARTEVVSASNAASLAVAQKSGVVAAKRWLATNDDRTRPAHAEADGQVVPVEEAFDVDGEELLYPGDPNGSPENTINCLLGETVVCAPGLRATTGRDYYGELVRVTCASGDDLTGTPNHPVLTGRGWVALGELKPGDYCVRGRIGGDLMGEPDEQWPPAKLAEVHDLAAVAGNAQRIHSTPPDFHGDGANQQIDLVPVDRRLWGDGEPPSDEQLRHFGFALADRASAAPNAEGSGLAVRRARGGDLQVIPTRLVGASGQGTSLVDAHAGETDAVGLAGGSYRQPQFVEASDDEQAAYTEVASDSEDAVALFVASTEVVEVERLTGSHRVYNMDTGWGWYIGNNLVQGNCRCTLTYETVEQTGDTEAEALVAAAEEAETMPWHIVEGGGDCADSEWAVIKDDDGSTAGCHGTREEAEAQLAALYASEDDGAEATLVAEADGPDGEHFHALAIVDGIETKEIPRRLFHDTTWRELPLPLMWQREDSHGGEPPPTVAVGKITRAERQGQELHVWGVLDLDGDDGREFARRLVGGFVKGVSVDAGDLVADDVELLWPDDEPESEEDLFMMAEPETVVLHGASLLGLTAVAFPAWDGPYVAALPPLVDALRDKGLEVESINVEDPSLAAGAGSGRCHECGSVLALAGRDGGGVRGDQGGRIEPWGAPGDLRGHGGADPGRPDDRSPLSAAALLQPGTHGSGDDPREPAASADVMGRESRGADTLREGAPLRRNEHGDEEARRPMGQNMPGLHQGGQPQEVPRGHRTITVTEPGVREAGEVGRQTLVAASHLIELTDRPPAWWFDEPVDQPVLGALTVTDEGRLYGWLAPDNVGHISPLFAGRTVPLGADYGRFYRGQPVRCADGSERMAGNVTMGCNHAPRQASVPEIEQFENTCAVFGRVAIGERKGVGVWVAGYVLPSVTADQVERAMACQLSGYWRQKERGSGVELFSALLVPVPGFPMARRSLRQSGAMVASSVPVQFQHEAAAPAAMPTLGDLAAVHEFAAVERSRRRERAAAYAAQVNQEV